MFRQQFGIKLSRKTMGCCVEQTAERLDRCIGRSVKICWRAISYMRTERQFEYQKDLFTRLPATKIALIKDFTPAVRAKVKAKVQGVELATRLARF